MKAKHNQLKARAAFAFALLQSKPPELSVSDYIAYLRSHAIRKQAIDLRDKPYLGKHLCQDDFWRSRCQDKEEEAVTLRTRLVELEEEKRLLTEENKVLKRELRQKYAKQGAKRTGTSTPTTPMVTAQTWRSVAKSYTPLSNASSTIIKELKYLHYARQPTDISTAFNKVTISLSDSIHDLSNQKATYAPSALTSLHTTSTRVKMQRMDDTWVSGVVYALDQCFLRLFLAIETFSSAKLSSGNDSRQICKTMMELFKSTLDSIHQNSHTVLSIKDTIRSITHGYDIRPGITNILISFVTSLNHKSTIQAQIIQGSFIIVLEAVGKCLCVPIKHSPKDKSALRETSQYIYRLLQAILPVYQQCCSQNNSVNATIDAHMKKRFNNIIMTSLFGQEQRREAKNDPNIQPVLSMIEKSKQWANLEPGCEFEIVDEEIAAQIWALLGLECFALTW